MQQKHLRLAVLGRFVQDCMAQEMARYEAATLRERREMVGIVRHLRTEVGMSQRVINRV